MENTMFLKLGGQDKGLLFDLGTLDTLTDITGVDAFQFSFRVDSAKGMIEDATNVIYAGLKCYAELKNVECKETREDVSKWVRRLTIPQIKDVILKFQSSYKSDASPEGGEDTQG